MPEVIKSTNLDANESAFFARQLEHIKARSYDVIYPDMKATRLIPVSMDAGPGAAVITYQQFDRVGVMKIIANYADDLPRSDIKGKEFSSPVRSLGGSYGYNVQEIRSARMAGLPLQQRKANAVRQSNDQKVNRLAWLARSGDGVNGGLVGLIYNPNVPSATVPAGTSTTTPWSTKTAQEIYDDMADCVQDTIDLTNGVEVPDTMILPVAQYGIAAKTRMAAGTDTTVLEFFKRNFPFIKNVEWVPELKNVNPIPSTLAASNTDIMITYKNMPDKITLEIPQAYEQFSAQERGLEFLIPCHSRCGGVIIYYPLAINIREGI